MAKLSTLHDGLLDGLKDLYHAEHQLLKALPKMEKKASNAKLKELFAAHFYETDGQINRLEKIGALLKEKLTGKVCKAMQGLIEEGKEVLEEKSENTALIDCLLICAATRVEHYEMAAYRSVVCMAKELGEEKIANMLEETLAEEATTDEKLQAVLEGKILSDACAASDDDEESSSPPSPSRSPKSDSKAAALRLIAVFGLSASGAASFSPLFAEHPSDAVKHERQAIEHDADDTGRNERDLNRARLTADDQSLTNGGETELLAEIRSKIVANEALSVYAKNIKIMVQEGAVTLRGPVRSEHEKTWIRSTAGKTAPNYQIIDELEIDAD